MEARFLLDAIGLAVTTPMILVVVLGARRPGARRPFLALVFLEAALYFLGDLLSLSKGTAAAALALNLGSLFYGLPSLYFFAREAAGLPAIRLLPHYLPALAAAPLGVGLALATAARDFRGGPALLAFMVLAPLAQAAQYLAYGRAALSLPRQGEGKPDWTRRAVLAVLFGYGAFLLLSWLGLGLLLAAEASGARPRPLPSVSLSSSLVAVFLAWTLGLCALWGKDAAETRAAAPKYGGRPLPEGEAAGLVERARALLAAEVDLSGEGVEPRRLAARLGAPYHDLSRAVNELTGASVADLVNEVRIERAKALLSDRPDLGILEVALEAGFAAKSTFNEVFRKRVGSSPSEYRKGLASGRPPHRGARA
jgi:AraC-like DNA-binding protein